MVGRDTETASGLTIQMQITFPSWAAHWTVELKDSRESSRQQSKRFCSTRKCGDNP